MQIEGTVPSLKGYSKFFGGLALKLITWYFNLGNPLDKGVTILCCLMLKTMFKIDQHIIFICFSREVMEWTHPYNNTRQITSTWSQYITSHLEKFNYHEYKLFFLRSIRDSAQYIFGHIHYKYVSICYPFQGCCALLLCKKEATC